MYICEKVNNYTVVSKLPNRYTIEKSRISSLKNRCRFKVIHNDLNVPYVAYLQLNTSSSIYICFVYDLFNVTTGNAVTNYVYFLKMND